MVWLPAACIAACFTLVLYTLPLLTLSPTFIIAGWTRFTIMKEALRLLKCVCRVEPVSQPAGSVDKRWLGDSPRSLPPSLQWSSIVVVEAVTKSTRFFQSRPSSSIFQARFAWLWCVVCFLYAGKLKGQAVMMVILLLLYRKPLDDTPFPSESVSTPLINVMDFSVNMVEPKTNYTKRITIFTRTKMHNSHHQHLAYDFSHTRPEGETFLLVRYMAADSSRLALETTLSVPNVGFLFQGTV